MLLLQARPCARSRERCARRAAVVGKAQDGRVRSGRVLPLCVRRRKGKGAGEGKGHKKCKSPKTPTGTDPYSELPSRFGCATLPTVHTYTSHLFHTSHLTLHTSHFTLHTSHFTLHTSHFTPPPPPPPPPPPTRLGPRAAQGQAPLIPGRFPCCSLAAPLSPATSAAFGGGAPCCSQGPALAEREPPNLPGAKRPLNGARMLIFLWLAWWGSHVSIGTGPVHRGLPPPCSSGSRNGTLLFLSAHTTVTGRLAPTGAAKSLLLLSVLSPTSSVHGV
jgi:hypothetical protein